MVYGYLLVKLFFIVAYFISSGFASYQRVCYVLTKKPHVLIPPEQLLEKRSLCTHIIFGFSSLDDFNVKVDEVTDQYIKSVMLRNANQTDLKFLISIGGDNFSFVNNDIKIIKFIDSVVSVLVKYNLDGIDIDWEFPYHQKIKFSKLLRALRIRFSKETVRYYFLTVALTPVMYIVELSYHIPSIAHYVDFVNLMTYDFHSPNTFPYTNFNSPLFASKLDLFYFKYFNIQFSVDYMRKLGLSSSKIMVGIPFYGYLYYLANKNFHGLYALSNGTQVSVNYNDICKNFLISPQTTRVFDTIAKAPYAYKNFQWITYDDEESVLIKSQWIVDQKLGGSMTFALNYDDFQSECSRSNRSFPLQTSIYDVLS